MISVLEKIDDSPESVMYEAMLEQLRAQKDAEKSATTNAAQDTGLLQS